MTKYILPLLIFFISCSKCPSPTKVQKWVDKGCISFKVYSISKHDSIYIHDTIGLHDTTVLKLIDTLSIIDSCFSKPKNKEALKKHTNKFIKENKGQICGFKSQIHEKNFDMYFTVTGNTFIYKLTNRTKVIEVNKDKWDIVKGNWHYILLVFVLGFISCLIIKK